MGAAAVVTEYRLSWESPDAWACAATEDAYGKNCWPRVNWDELPGWHRTEVVFTDDERMDQYHTLAKWAETREQPIRNVTLEQRQTVAADEGWEPASTTGHGPQAVAPESDPS